MRHADRHTAETKDRIASNTDDSLERQHRELFGDRVGVSDIDSLEQPYAGEVVETVTTYSVYEEPITTP